jgi:predicted transposase YdaD
MPGGGTGHPDVVRRGRLQFIETVTALQFPKWSRAEVEQMLQVTDLRQTRVYQDALEEGIEKGVEIVARRMLEAGRPAAEVAQFTGLSVARVRKLAKKPKE